MTPGRHHRVATGASVLAGVVLACQARINGSLTQRLGAAVPTAAVSFSVGTVALVLVVLATRSWRPALEAMRAAPPPWWYCVGGVGGAALVSASAAAVPVIGVALLSVFLVAGQTTGGLLVDRVGLGPGGAHHLTRTRVVGATTGVLALLVGALGRVGDARVSSLLLVAIVAAGVMVAGQQAVNGRLRELSGEATVASLISFLGGTIVLVVASVALGAAGRLPVLHWPSAPWLYLGGLGGAAYITLAAATVRTLGVLRLGLASVAGQLLGSLLLDALAPARSGSLRATTVVAVVMSFLAVAIAGRRSG